MLQAPLGDPQCLAVLTCLEWQLGTQRAGLHSGSHLLPGALRKGWASLVGVETLFPREPVNHSFC